MSTPHSADVSSQTFILIAMFLDDGHVAFFDQYGSAGRRHEGGDILNVSRELKSDSETEVRLELAVVLGWGETREEAVSESKAYIRRVAKWHGDGDEFEMSLFGYDLSQSEALM